MPSKPRRSSRSELTLKYSKIRDECALGVTTKTIEDSLRPTIRTSEEEEEEEEEAFTKYFVLMVFRW